MKKHLWKLGKTLLFWAILLLLLVQTNYVLRNKNLAEEVYCFYQEEPNSLDVLFVGSSHIMCGIYPDLLEQNFGLKSYDCASSAMVLPQCYYQLLEALRYQTPKLVVLDASGSAYGDVKTGTAEYAHIQLDNFRFSANKIAAIYDLIEPESRKEYLFPLIVFHTRWKELKCQDLEPIVSDTRGAVVYTKQAVVGELPTLIPREDRTPLAEVPESYLRKCLDECRARDIPVLLLCTPTLYDEQTQRMYNSVDPIAAEYGVPYLNLHYSLDEMGFDLRTDMADEGHCNDKGAAKVTAYVGAYIMEMLGNNEN